MRTATLFIQENCNVKHATSIAPSYCTRHGMFILECEMCGTEFHAKRSHTGTCSNKCRVALSRKNTASKV